MSPIPAVDERLVTLVREVELDQDHLRRVIGRLTAIGSSPIGFRNTGTPEDAAVADFVAEQMRRLGLHDVAIEPVEVDAWRFLAASVAVGTDAGAASSAQPTYRAVSFGGVPATPPGGISARLVDIGDGRRTRWTPATSTGHSSCWTGALRPSIPRPWFWNSCSAALPG